MAKENTNNAGFFFVQVITVLACLLSAVFSGLFWMSLGSQTISKTLLVASGLLFDATKVVALPLCCKFWRQKSFVKSLISAIMYILPSLVSVFAGVSVLHNSIMQNQQQEVQSSQVYQADLKAIELQEIKIQGLIEHATSDVKARYSERSKGTFADIGREQEKLEKMKSQLQDLINTNTTSSVAFLPMLNGSEQKLFLAFIILLGGLLEVTTGYLLFITSNQQRKETSKPQGQALCPALQAMNDGQYVTSAGIKLPIVNIEREIAEEKAPPSSASGVITPMREQQKESLAEELGEITPEETPSAGVITSNGENREAAMCDAAIRIEHDGSKDINGANKENAAGVITPQQGDSVCKGQLSDISSEKGRGVMAPGFIKGESYSGVVEQVTSGCWPPIKKEIKKLAKAGSRKVDAWFSQMLLDGVVYKEGGRYHVCAYT